MKIKDLEVKSNNTSDFCVMSKYHEAYKLASNLAPKDILDKKVRKDVDLVKEACDKADKYDEKEKSPTIEEAKKEWEDLGWNWHYFYNENGIWNKYRITKYVPSRKRDDSGDYQLEIYLCDNTKTFNINFDMDMQEYQLLTKTFKALGWL